jgi:hypothetical protein
MNSFLASELAGSLHREMIGRGDQRRREATARRQQKARRLNRRSAALARRAADLVARTHG